MVHRPVDGTGDILPVLSSASLLRGVQAEAQGIRDRLGFLTGEWWENPAWGNAVVDMLKASRFTDADRQALASYLSSYILETPGVQDVRDVSVSLDGRQLHYSCTVETADGSVSVNYEL